MLSFIPEESANVDPAAGDSTISIANNNDDRNEGDHIAGNSLLENPAKHINDDCTGDDGCTGDVD